ncbi:MAG: hypothetical protein M3O67_01215 [Bacteroidota bacterium]|nr:hypothetical protein [Bacteroidota bacterium]
MDNDNKIQTRKRFIGLGITTAALLTAFRFFIPEKKKKTENVKMLTQDGKLVEVDVTNLGCGNRKKISDDELKSWVKNK